MIAQSMVSSLGKLAVAVLLQSGGFGSWMGVAPLVFIFAVFYFFLIMPQQRRQKKWQAMLETLKAGDKVVTSGGLKGTVFSIKDDAIILRVPPDNLKLEVSRSSIVTLTTAEEEAKK
jgi:preprotein translocase subunit YajC